MRRAGRGQLAEAWRRGGCGHRGRARTDGVVMDLCVYADGARRGRPPAQVHGLAAAGAGLAPGDSVWQKLC